jgi:hypothetical protein
LTGVRDVTNRKHQVIQVDLTFSGPLDPAEAGNASSYQLIERGKGGRYVATKAMTIPVKSASYNGSDDTVTLTPRPFALSKPVEVVVGVPPSGLRDAEGRPIVGNGASSGEATAVLSKGGVAMVNGPTPPTSTPADAVDALIAQSESDRLLRGRADAWLGR